jgi:High-temperature-induced dauer-formation protein
MTSPSFLLAKESNPALLHILLETITHIIESQHSQNPILLYAIIRNHYKFEQLQHFDLQKALAEVEERKKTKEEKDVPRRASEVSVAVETPTTPAAAFSVGDEEDQEEEETKPLSEKARGKLPEGVEIPRRESSFSIRSNPGLLSPSSERRDFHPTEHWVPSPILCSC